MEPKTHGIFDYLTSILLIISPWIFGFANGGLAQWIIVVFGILILGTAIFTRYEFGAVKTIPMRIHLTIDVIIGLVLIPVPWILGFAGEIFWPYVVFGLLISLAGVFTKYIPSEGPTLRT